MSASSTNGLKKFLLNLFRDLDYFGVNVNFNIKDKRKYQSIFGGVTFIVFAIISISYIFLNFQSFASRSVMNLVFNQQYLKSAPKLSLEDYKVGMAVGLDVDGDSNLLNLAYKYFDINFNLVNYTKVKGIFIKTKVAISLDKCEKGHFYNKANDSYDSMKLYNYFCPNTTNTTIEGIFTDEIFTYYEFVTTLKPAYYNNAAEIYTMFQNREIRASFVYLDTSIDVYIVNEPVSKQLNSYFISLDFSTYKRMNLNFMNLSFISDENILFRNEVPTFNIILDYKEEYFSIIGDNRFVDKPNNFGSLAKMFIRSSPRAQLNKRIYQKLTEYLANTSGILSQILLILFVLLSYINHFKARQSVMKKIMKFKENLQSEKSDSIKYMKDKFSSDSK